MTQPGPDGRPRELRRLPKQPVRAAQNAVHQTQETRDFEESTQAPAPKPDLYFEALPDLLPQESGDDFASSHSAPVLQNDSRAFAEDPFLYFRHSVPVAPAAGETPAARVWEAPAPTRTENPRLPVPAAPAAPSLPFHERRDEVIQRHSEEHARQPNGQVQPPFLDPGGDPKPASNRPANASRSRLARSSGQFPVARSSGQFPAARTSGAFPIARTSGSYPVARISGEVLTAAPSDRDESLYESRKNAVRDETPPLESAKERAASTGTRRGGKGRAAAGMALASVALVAYAFQIGPLESAADAEVRSLANGGPVLSSLLPWLLVVPAVLLFGLIVWLLAGIIGLRRPQNKPRAPRKEKQPKTPLNQFKKSALRQGVDNRTAYRGWRLLEAACGNDCPVTVESSLTDDLGLAPREIRSVHLQFLTDLSRASDPAMRLPATETVLDLLKAVDAAPMARPAATSGEVAIPGDPGQRKRKNVTNS